MFMLPSHKPGMSLLVQARERADGARSPLLQMKQAIQIKSYFVGRSKLTPGFLDISLETEIPLSAPEALMELLPPHSSSQRTRNRENQGKNVVQTLKQQRPPTCTECTRL